VNSLAIVALAVSLSADSFVVSVGRGAAIGRPRMSEALRTGIVFGVIEALTPLAGWAAGHVANRYLEAFDHWIAFGLLVAVGVNMLYAAWRGADADTPAPAANGSFIALVASAVGTSLDAMAVGASLALLDVDIVTIALAVGLTTFILSCGGMLIGRTLGERFGRRAEFAAGILLCAIGVMILIEHTAM
jgi:putative Mn2+ efflux pump MntP